MQKNAIETSQLFSNFQRANRNACEDKSNIGFVNKDQENIVPYFSIKVGKQNHENFENQSHNLKQLDHTGLYQRHISRNGLKDGLDKTNHSLLQDSLNSISNSQILNKRKDYLEEQPSLQIKNQSPQETNSHLLKQIESLRLELQKKNELIEQQEHQLKLLEKTTLKNEELENTILNQKVIIRQYELRQESYQKQFENNEAIRQNFAGFHQNYSQQLSSIPSHNSLRQSLLHQKPMKMCVNSQPKSQLQRQASEDPQNSLWRRINQIQINQQRPSLLERQKSFSPTSNLKKTQKACNISQKNVLQLRDFNPSIDKQKYVTLINKREQNNTEFIQGQISQKTLHDVSDQCKSKGQAPKYGGKLFLSRPSLDKNRNRLSSNSTSQLIENHQQAEHHQSRYVPLQTQIQYEVDFFDEERISQPKRDNIPITQNSESQGHPRIQRKDQGEKVASKQYEDEQSNLGLSGGDYSPISHTFFKLPQEIGNSIFETQNQVLSYNIPNAEIIIQKAKPRRNRKSDNVCQNKQNELFKFQNSLFYDSLAEDNEELFEQSTSIGQDIKGKKERQTSQFQSIQSDLKLDLAQIVNEKQLSEFGFEQNSQQVKQKRPNDKQIQKNQKGAPKSINPEFRQVKKKLLNSFKNEERQQSSASAIFNMESGGINTQNMRQYYNSQLTNSYQNCQPKTKQIQTQYTN